mmetsp:Transcript_27999/g.52130  ORF Transcript_27999/g.52130 Transcript_27999/m.52130 type:complete len:213 (+) Transcript_27999:639-1277(+)
MRYGDGRRDAAAELGRLEASRRRRRLGGRRRRCDGRGRRRPRRRRVRIRRPPGQAPAVLLHGKHGVQHPHDRVLSQLLLPVYVRQEPPDRLPRHRPLLLISVVHAKREERREHGRVPSSLRLGQRRPRLALVAITPADGEEYDQVGKEHDRPGPAVDRRRRRHHPLLDGRLELGLLVRRALLLLSVLLGRDPRRGRPSSASASSTTERRRRF